MAGFITKFAQDYSISEHYAKNLNRYRKVPHGVQKYSRHVQEALLAAPEELREEIVSSGKHKVATYADWKQVLCT